ncbi:hypothetical protein OF83DRAFT_475397 [Amylostereum chailletii]|nr:hypothetical protein OF83DRAFT_475397 [Amylostereum chailletii]
MSVGCHAQSTQGTHWTIYPAPDRFSLAFGFQTQSFPLDRDFAAYDDVVAICDTLEEDPTWMEMPKSTSSYSKPPSSSKSDMAVIHPHLSAQSSIPPTPHAVNTSIPPPPSPSCIHPFTPRVTPRVTRYFSTKDNRKPRGCVANLRVRGHLPSPKDCPRARGSGLRYTAIMEFMGDCVRKETMVNLADLKVLIAAEGKAKSREKLAHVEPSVMRHVYYRPSDDLPVIQEEG